MVGSHVMELAMKLVQMMLKKLSQGIIENDHLTELSIIVANVATQFALQQSALKFEALHLLSAIFSSEYSTLLHDALRVIPNENWSSDGVVTILQNRVAPAEKFEALILAESMVSMFLSRLIARSLASWGQGISDVAIADMDLLEIVTAG